MAVRLAPSALALPLLLSGCFGMCGFMPDSADWDDAALFAAMPVPGPTADGGRSTWTAPEPGLPFTTPVDPAWGLHNLTMVEHIGVPYIALAPNGLTVLPYEGTGSIRPALLSFLGNATDLDAAGREAYADGVLANATQEGPYYEADDTGELVEHHELRYAAAPPAELDLDGLYAALAAVGAIDVGEGWARAGPWAFSFSLASRELATDDGRLTVDPLGHARFGGFAKGERDEADYEADVRGWLARQGLPAPAMMHVGGSIC